MKTPGFDALFPLTVAGAEALAGLPEAPNPPIRLEGAERAAWERMPLSKRRLAVMGALEAGTQAALSTAIIIAAEAKAQDLPFPVAEKLACQIKYQTGRTHRHRVLRQLKRGAAFAYEPPNGQPVLSGCCRDPRPRSPRSGAATGRMRSLMAPYCDEACAKTCPMLKAIRHTQLAVAETDYANVLDSSIFQTGSGLGESGRAAYELLALLATLNPERNVAASAGYLVYKSGGLFTREAFQKALKALNEWGLAPIVGVEKKLHTAIRHVPVQTDQMIRALEIKLGVAGKRKRNMSDAARSAERYQDWLYQVMSGAEKIDAWTLPEK